MSANDLSSSASWVAQYTLFSKCGAALSLALLMVINVVFANAAMSGEQVDFSTKQVNGVRSK